MTDLPRLGASLSVLGTLYEDKGDKARLVLHGWGHGPRLVDNGTERGGGLGTAGEDDRKAEAKRRARAAEMHAEFQDIANQLERLADRGLRLFAVALPIHPAELRNQRTGDLDPITTADAAAAGWCASCWRNDQHLTIIETNKHSLRYFRDYCRWCGGVKSTYGIEPPLSMLKLHHDGRRIAEKDMTAAVEAVLEAMPKKPQTKKARRAARRKGQAA